MTDNLPDYAAMEPPEGKEPTEYTTHERRADVLREAFAVGSPFAVNRARLARKYGVHRSTISRDFDRLRESVGDEHLATDAKFSARVIYERALAELLRADDWRAKKAAFDMSMDWQQWLADLGEQHREPTKSEVDVRSRHSEVSYTIVRGGEDDPLPETETGDVDHEALGFTSGPVTVEVEERGERNG